MSQIFDQFSRIIFERGVELLDSPEGRVTTANSKIPIEVSTSYVTNKLGLSAILVDLPQHSKAPQLGPTSFLVPRRTKRLLEFEQSDNMQRAYRFLSENQGKGLTPGVMNLNYIVHAVLYHCQRLAEIYVEICRRFTRLPSIFEGSDIVVNSGEFEPYIEFESLITDVMRTYNAMRSPIWNAHGGKGDFPRSFELLLKAITQGRIGVPEQLADRLNESWERYGRFAREYRDCIQHYLQLGGLMPSTRMYLLEGKIWSTTAWIPDNPEEKLDSIRKFSFESRLDALSYGWELSDEVVELAREIIDALSDR